MLTSSERWLILDSSIKIRSVIVASDYGISPRDAEYNLLYPQAKQVLTDKPKPTWAHAIQNVGSIVVLVFTT